MKYALSLDVVMNNGYLYTEFVNNLYTGQAIIFFKLDLAANTVEKTEVAAEIDMTGVTSYAILSGTFKFTEANQLVNQTANCGNYTFNHPESYFFPVCTFAIQM